VSGATVSEFLDYWRQEGDAYVRAGDYEWMAAQVPGRRILEVGCGLGFGSAALVARGQDVLAIDSLPECLAATRERLGDDAARMTLMAADVTALDAEQMVAIQAFTPDVVICWLMGAPVETTGATSGDAGQAVAAYREGIHRQVAELAERLPSVRALHFVDRTAIAWQAKDLGRDTLVRYHQGKTLLGLPFVAERRNALYRKLEGSLADLAQIRRSHPSLRNVVPVLASLLVERKN